jgi:hypothetical protein
MATRFAVLEARVTDAVRGHLSNAEATIGASPDPVSVIFDDAYVSAGGMFESTGPQCHGKTSDLAAAVQGAAITINGQAYTVTGNQPDGTGMTVLQLREA